MAPSLWLWNLREGLLRAEDPHPNITGCSPWCCRTCTPAPWWRSTGRCSPRWRWPWRDTSPPATRTSSTVTCHVSRVTSCAMWQVHSQQEWEGSNNLHHHLHLRSWLQSFLWFHNNWRRWRNFYVNADRTQVGTLKHVSSDPIFSLK